MDNLTITAKSDSKDTPEYEAFIEATLDGWGVKIDRLVGDEKEIIFDKDYETLEAAIIQAFWHLEKTLIKAL